MPHILIVDDDIQISEMLTEKLETEGYTVSAAYSGTEALMFESSALLVDAYRIINRIYAAKATLQ